MDCRIKPGNDEVKSERPSRRASVSLMQDFPVVPPIVVKDTPKPRRLTSLSQARAYVDEAMRLGRPEPWRELWHRLKSVANEEDAIEAIGDMRELLAEEDLLLPSG
jgi:hypothetical protein